MGLGFKIIYHEKVRDEDIKKLNTKEKVRVKKTIEAKLTTRPGDFGKPLRRSLKGYRSLIVGSKRVIYRIKKNTVKVLVIGDRSWVYTKREREM
jgi:mRNA interferase RelE/StbE